ncbi:MAG: hypothetical protein ACM3WV_05955 [Bacillota bacterium]
MTKVDLAVQERICQGDIFKNIEYIEYAVEKNGIIEISKILFPYVIILTQDCDLAQDYTFRWSEPKKSTQDKYLLSLLVAPIYNIEHFYDGEHLKDLGLQMEKFERRPDKTPNKNLKQNLLPRYHYLEFPENVPIVPSVIDFKHYFTVNIEYLLKIKTENFVCKISELYREDISHRFASFLSRIGLPSR